MSPIFLSHYNSERMLTWQWPPYARALDTNQNFTSLTLDVSKHVSRTSCSTHSRPPSEGQRLQSPHGRRIVSGGASSASAVLLLHDFHSTLTVKPKPAPARIVLAMSAPKGVTIVMVLNKKDKREWMTCLSLTRYTPPSRPFIWSSLT